MLDAHRRCDQLMSSADAIRHDDTRDPGWDDHDDEGAIMRARRVGPSALTVFAGASIISTGLVSAFLAGTHPAQSAYTTAVTNTCGPHPATAAVNSAVVTTALAHLQLDSVFAVGLATATPTASAIASATASSTS